jgi:uncharacterized protein YwqG
MATDLARHVTEFGLDDHREYLLGIARPCVEIFTATAAITKGCSRVGGSPDLPSDFKWPDHKLGLYRFFCQINFADIPKGPFELPRTGLLSFFYAHDENGESFWGDANYVRVFRFDKVEALTSVKPPSPANLGSASKISFQLGTDLPSPPWGEAEKTWPIGEEQRDAYSDLRDRLHLTDQVGLLGWLFGYPRNGTLAYDPTPGPEWRSLLTLRSDDKLEWCWHDGDTLVTFIEEARLRVGDFSQIKSDAG